LSHISSCSDLISFFSLPLLLLTRNCLELVFDFRILGVGGIEITLSKE